MRPFGAGLIYGKGKLMRGGAVYTKLETFSIAAAWEREAGEWLVTSG